MTTPDKLWHSAGKFGLSQVDRSIAVWLRQYAEPQPLDWIRAENTLMRILLNLAIIPPESLMPANGESDVVANALARALGNCDRDTDYSTDYLTTLSALAFASAGNFASASVFAKRACRNANSGAAEKWFMTVLADRHLNLFKTEPPPGFTGYVQVADHALRSGLPEDFDRARIMLDAACKESFDALERTDRYLLLFWRQIQKRLEELSITRILIHEMGFSNQKYIAELIKTSPLFYPSQAHTLREQPLIQPNGSILLTLPTSTGKSLLGEISLVSSLSWGISSRWLSVYLAPYRALTDQLQQRMVRRLRNVAIRCIPRRGGYLSDVSPLESGYPTILVATPEAFDSLLRQRPELYTHLAACVFDEFHLIEQQERGLRYEGILGRLLNGAGGDGFPKIVALSAVIGDTNQVVKWMRMEDSNVVKFPWRPTGRRLAIAGPDGEILYFTPGEKLPGSPDSAEVAWQGQKDLPNVLQLPTVQYPSALENYRERVAQNVVAIAVDQWNKFHQPILILASSRKQTKLISSIVARHFSELDEDDEARRFATMLHFRFPYLYTLHRCLIHGVVYHNASLPDWVRSQLERLIEQKKLKIVVATTTLAEGVDLPFRVVVLADWRLWRFGQQQSMPTLLFRNIAGRCGRAWEFVEGDTIIVDSPDSVYETYTSRNQKYIDLYVKPSPYSLHSSVEMALDSGVSQVLKNTMSVLESQFSAHLAILSGSENTENHFTHSLYAGLNPESVTYIEKGINQFAQDMISEPRYPVMSRNSPLQLTDFGQVVLKTGLSPRSGIALAYFVQDFNCTEAPSDYYPRIRMDDHIEWESIIANLWSRLQNSSDIQELEGSDRQKIGKVGYPVNVDNFLLVTMAWLSGVPIEVIGLRTFRRVSEERGQILAWLNGEQSSPTIGFEEDIEQIAIFTSGYLAEQWAWVLRGLSTIASEYMNADEIACKADILSKRIKYGVKHLDTVNLLADSACPIDRAKLDWLVEGFHRFTFILDGSLEPQLFLGWIREQAESLRGKAFTQFRGIKITEGDIEELENFLQIKVNREQQ